MFQSHFYWRALQQGQQSVFIPYRLELNMYKLNISGATLDKCPQKGIDVFLSAPSCCEGSLSFARRLTTSGMRVEWEESNKTPVDLHVSLYTTRELLPVCGQPDPPHLAAGLQTSPDVERALPPLFLFRWTHPDLFTVGTFCSRSNSLIRNWMKRSFTLMC